MYDFTTLGAVVGLAIAIVLIIRKVHPAYSLILGALVGGIIGGGGLVTTVNTMVSGAQSMMSSVLRIMTSGILAGALIRTGSAQKIAETIVDKMGQRLALAAIALATMIICAVGVFIDISVITVAPIALAIGKRARLNKQSLLLAMIGGGKAGNIISPNPNTIAASEAFGVDLTSLMFKNLVPAIFALAPLAGILMAGATASTTAGATIAAQTFAPTLIGQGVPALAAGAMVHAGATVVDSLPHGSFFHATGGSVNLSIGERMKLIPFEACVGLTATLVSVVMFLMFG